MSLIIDRRRLLAAGTALAALPAAASASAAAVARSRPRPFQIAIPQAKVDDILRRVRDAILPRPLAPDDWSTGADTRWLAGLRTHWLEDYDWRTAERDLNRYPQFLVQIEGMDVHFYHVPGEGPAPAR